MSSNPQQPVVPNSGTTPASGTSTTPTTASAPTTPLTPAQQQSLSTASSGTMASGQMGGTVSSMAQLKTQAPQVYKAIMQGIAMNICSQSDQFNKNMKEYIDEMNQEDNM